MADEQEDFAALMSTMVDGWLSAMGVRLNQTSFLHATRAGTLRATARPLVRGRRSHLWEANVTDGAGRIVATGRVRLLVLEADQALPGSSPM